MLTKRTIVSATLIAAASLLSASVALAKPSASQLKDCEKYYSSKICQAGFAPIMNQETFLIVSLKDHYKMWDSKSKTTDIPIEKLQSCAEYLKKEYPDRLQGKKQEDLIRMCRVAFVAGTNKDLFDMNDIKCHYDVYSKKDQDEICEHENS